MSAAAPRWRGSGRVGRLERRAVTLFELLVVASILLAIMALAAPLAAQSMRGRAFRAAEIDVSEAISSARAHAQREGVIIEVAWDGSGRRIIASAWPLDGTDPQPIEALRFNLPDAVQLVVEGGDTIALFLPDGSAPLVRTCVLSGESREEALVSISPSLGRVSIERRRATAVVEDGAPEDMR